MCDKDEDPGQDPRKRTKQDAPLNKAMGDAPANKGGDPVQTKG